MADFVQDVAVHVDAVGFLFQNPTWNSFKSKSAKLFERNPIDVVAEIAGRKTISNCLM